MPNFPTYYGPPLPKVLNPLDLRHYWLLFKWIFFQPSRLKHYLHKADPELYQATGRHVFTQIPRQSAYRNAYIMSLVLTITLAIGLAVIVSALQGTSVSWLGVVGGCGGVGVAFGVAVGVVRSVVFGVIGGVAIGVTLSVVFNVTRVVTGAWHWV